MKDRLFGGLSTVSLPFLARKGWLQPAEHEERFTRACSKQARQLLIAHSHCSLVLFEAFRKSCETSESVRNVVSHSSVYNQ